MATLNQALKNAQKLSPQKMELILFQKIKQIEKDLIRLNRKQIFNDSSDIFGNKPLGTYSKATEKLSKGRKKAGSNYTLFDKGDFLGGMFLKIENNQVLFGTNDSKKEKVFETLRIFGNGNADIFGLTDTNLKQVIQEKLLLLYLKEIRKVLEI